MPVEVGRPAPDFTLPSHEATPEGKPGKPVSLKDFRGKRNVVLAFFPLDFSPVCSKENGSFVNDLKQFEGLNAQVLGISVDSVWSHAAFAEKLHLKYPLLADFHPKGKVAASYGLYLEDKGITSRATVIVDKEGVVRFVRVQEIPQQRDNKAILDALRALK